MVNQGLPGSALRRSSPRGCFAGRCLSAHRRRSPSMRYCRSRRIAAQRIFPHWRLCSKMSGATMINTGRSSRKSRSTSPHNFTRCKTSSRAAEASGLLVFVLLFRFLFCLPASGVLQLPVFRLPEIGKRLPCRFIRRLFISVTSGGFRGHLAARIL